MQDTRPKRTSKLPQMVKIKRTKQEKQRVAMSRLTYGIMPQMPFTGYQDQKTTYTINQGTETPQTRN